MSPDSQRFHDLSPLLINEIAEIPAGKPLSLLMLHHVPSGDGVLFPVDFIPADLEFRTPGKKDAVLHGSARLEGDGDYQPARILFSQYHQTASLVGLSVGGRVKRA